MADVKKSISHENLKDSITKTKEKHKNMADVKKSISQENLKDSKTKTKEKHKNEEKAKVPGYAAKLKRAVPVEKLREIDFKERKENFKKIQLSRRLEVANKTINMQQEIIYGLEKKVSQIAKGLEKSDQDEAKNSMEQKAKPIFTQNEHGKFENRSCDSPCDIDINQLKLENEILKEKLSAIRGVSEGCKTAANPDNMHRGYIPKEPHCRSYSSASPNMMPCNYNPMCYSKTAAYNEICDRLEQEYLLDAMYRYPADFYTGFPPAYPTPLLRGAKSCDDITRAMERDFLNNQLTYVRPRSRTRSYDACRPTSSRSSRPVRPRSRTRSFEDPGFSFRWDEDPYFLERWKYSGFTRMPFRPRSTLDIAIGMKVSLHRSDGRLSRGIVRWIGMLPNLPGEYIGVELETQTGKHDGYLNGIRYFKCRENCGIFVKSSKIIMAWR